MACLLARGGIHPWACMTIISSAKRALMAAASLEHRRLYPMAATPAHQCPGRGPWVLQHAGVHATPPPQHPCSATRSAGTHLLQLQCTAGLQLLQLKVELAGPAPPLAGLLLRSRHLRTQHRTPH